MKLDSKSNLFFRMILYISYLVLIWFPTIPYLFIFPILFSMLDDNNNHKRLKTLAILLIACCVFYFYLNNLDLEQQIGLSLVVLLLGFSVVLRKAFKKNTI